MDDLEALKAAFLAKGGKVQTVAAGEAYGASNAPAKQGAARAFHAKAREPRFDEVAHDRRREAAHDAFMTGDRDEGYRLLSKG